MPRHLLLVENSPGHIRAARAVFASGATIRVARSAHVARQFLLSHSFDGVVVSSALADEMQGVLGAVAESRARSASLLVTGRGTSSLDEMAARYGVTVSDRPLTSPVASAFLATIGGGRSLEGPRDSVVARMLSVLADLRDRAGLTPTQTDVLVASAFGETREDLRERLRVSDTTLRKHVSATLHKASSAGLESTSLERLVCSLYLRAMLQVYDD